MKIIKLSTLCLLAGLIVFAFSGFTKSGRPAAKKVKPASPYYYVHATVNYVSSTPGAPQYDQYVYTATLYDGLTNLPIAAPTDIYVTGNVYFTQSGVPYSYIGGQILIHQGTTSESLWVSTDPAVPATGYITALTPNSYGGYPIVIQ